MTKISDENQIEKFNKTQINIPGKWQNCSFSNLARSWMWMAGMMFVPEPKTGTLLSSPSQAVWEKVNKLGYKMWLWIHIEK